ncbi:ATP-dependent Clp protease proteolytic subunit [Streptomyces sp. NPDC126497]|uniref:ATP-dependent Clp protease proteolytic subunit n=1 Tax=Streptomyces sp. NPDC126497 TaxID=3155313 RepID=UPI00333444A5
MTRPAARHVLPGPTERTASGNRPTDPCSKPLEGRVAALGTPIDETSANDVVAQPVHLEHHSPGGSFHAAPALRRPSLPEPVEERAGDPAIRAGEPARVRSRTEELPVRHTGRTAERVRAEIERDAALDVRAAVEYGPADRIVTGRGIASPAPGAR